MVAAGIGTGVPARTGVGAGVGGGVGVQAAGKSAVARAINIANKVFFIVFTSKCAQYSISPVRGSLGNHSNSVGSPHFPQRHPLITYRRQRCPVGGEGRRISTTILTFAEDTGLSGCGQVIQGQETAHIRFSGAPEDDLRRQETSVGAVRFGI
jgi:hypothetical protein